MEDVRGELAAIAREAQVLLARERDRGRARLASVASVIVAERSSAAPSRSAAVASVDPVDAVHPIDPACQPLASAPRGSRPLTLPGFESSVSSGSIAAKDDLPSTLPELAQMVASCRRCRLCETRTRTVFADGSPAARLMFVGEAPGRDEDAQGVPFVGRAGQLLDKMIAAIEMKREEVYICNVLKCRPPENRVPAPDEVEQCRGYLERQIALVRPALICALGLSAAQALLGTKASMASMRGKTFQFGGVPLIPTYHPAALLRNPSLKREAWVDLQRVRDTLRAPAERS